MQPEPLTILRGTAREILRYAPQDFTGGLIMRRAADALMHLAVRASDLPAILESVRAWQVELLTNTLHRLQEFGLGRPANLESLLGSVAHAPPHSADAVCVFEQLAAAQSTCIVQLASHAEKSTAIRNAVAEIARAACALEQDVRERFSAAVRAMQEADANSPAPADAQFRPPTEEGLTAYLRERFPQFPSIKVSHLSRLRAVNQKEIHLLAIDGHPDWPTSVVMRRDRPFSTAKTTVAAEFGELDLLFRAGLPVPRPLLVEPNERAFEMPFLFLERVAGQQQVITAATPNGRVIMTELARALAALHTIDPRCIPRNPETYSQSPRERALALIDKYYDYWTAERIEPCLTLESAYAWLRANVELADCDAPLSLVHGDCDFRNMLLHDGHLSAVLDWELLHVGDPAEDLGYCRHDVEQVMPWREFMQIYRDNGGRTVSEPRLRFFQIYGYVFRITTAASAYVAFSNGQHRDYIFGTVGFLEYPQSLAVLAELLRR